MLQNCQGFAPGCRHAGALIRESGPHRTVASLATLRLNSSCQLVARIWLRTEISAFETKCMCFWSARSRGKLLQIFCHRFCPTDSFSHYETGFALYTPTYKVNSLVRWRTLVVASSSTFGIMSFVPTKYLMDQQNIERNSSFLIWKCENFPSSLAYS